MHLQGGNNKFTFCVEILMGEPEQKKLFRIYRRRRDNVIMDIKPIGYDGVWIELTRHRF